MHQPEQDYLVRIINQFLVFSVFCFLFSLTCLADEPGWKAGTGKIDITPTETLWMAGYGSRTKPAEGALHPLWIKALALEDAEGNRAIIYSTDTLGIPRTVYDNVCQQLKEKLNLDRSQIMLNASHTHCGPVLRGALYDAYPLDEKNIARINEYSIKFEKMVVDLAESAFDNLQPATLSTGRGMSQFAVNRRNNREPDVPMLRKKNALQGPVDHDVPVLVVRNNKGELQALVFGYACHNTTMSFYQWCGDYAGFAQMALEEHHPGVQAMFYMGCGADQNPLPRRHVFLAQRYGDMLAAAVEEALLRPLDKLSPTLQTEHAFVELEFGTSPTREELTKISQEGARYRSQWAKRLLAELDTGRDLARTYRYPMQVWKIGGEQLWVTMGGEVVVDYALAIKKQFGNSTWIAGYCNDVMSYIPSRRVLDEGGYEGNTSMMVYGVPAHRWANDVEERIMTALNGLMEKVATPTAAAASE